MKKTVTPLRSLCDALAALVLLLALAVPAFAAENGFADLYYRLNDSAEVLTEDENSELEASLEELSVRQSFDVTIATIDSLESEGYTAWRNMPMTSMTTVSSATVQTVTAYCCW